MRLIDAHEYVKELAAERDWPGRSQDFMDAIDCAWADLSDMPTIEAKPVVHGRWEKDFDMRRMDGHIYDYRCSVCHSPAHKGCYNNNDRFTNYCPYCGAKMDLKSEGTDE